jgi:hypothetical protein
MLQESSETQNFGRSNSNSSIVTASTAYEHEDRPVSNLEEWVRNHKGVGNILWMGWASARGSRDVLWHDWRCSNRRKKRKCMMGLHSWCYWVSVTSSDPFWSIHNEKSEPTHVISVHWPHVSTYRTAHTYEVEVIRSIGKVIWPSFRDENIYHFVCEISDTNSEVKNPPGHGGVCSVIQGNNELVCGWTVPLSGHKHVVINLTCKENEMWTTGILGMSVRILSTGNAE